jgi:GR25 family glycosyltransferase involved in LPS biosynthesis
MEKIDFGIVVIALNGEIRNSHQINLKFLSKFSKFEILESITPFDLGCNSQLKNHYHSRDLTCVERAASVSHQVARNIASTFDTDWVIIMEDDAIIGKNFFTFLFEIATTKFFQIQKPIGFHLFPEQFGVLKTISTNVAKVYLIPDYAVAYALNKQALKFSMGSSDQCSRFLADWPKFLKSINWFAPLQSTVFHPEMSSKFDLNSSIQLSRNNRLSQLNRFSIYDKFKRLILIVSALFLRDLGTAKISSPKLRSKYL